MFLKSGSNPLMSNELVIKRIINSYIFPREWHDITKTMTFFIECLKLHCNILKYHYYVFPKPAEAVKDFALSDRPSKYRHFIQDKILSF